MKKNLFLLLMVSLLTACATNRDVVENEKSVISNQNVLVKRDSNGDISIYGDVIKYNSKGHNVIYSDSIKMDFSKYTKSVYLNKNVEQYKECTYILDVDDFIWWFGDDWDSSYCNVRAYVDDEYLCFELPGHFGRVTKLCSKSRMEFVGLTDCEAAALDDWIAQDPTGSITKNCK